MQKRFIDYTQYQHLLNELVCKLRGVKADGLYGIPRGGLPIAVHLSHFFGVPMIDSDISLLLMSSSQTVLLIDDIVDTGRTIEMVKRSSILHANVIVAALFKRPQIDFVDYYVEETTDWIVFPWESTNETPSKYHQEVYNEFFSTNQNKEET